jgi:hypothetical protein
MATKKFTLLELHLDDGSIQLGSKTLRGSGPSDDEPDAEAGDESGESAGSTVGKLLLASVALALLAAVAKRVLGGGDDLDELEDLADLDEAEA